jgi:hypothetical protein
MVGCLFFIFFFFFLLEMTQGLKGFYIVLLFIDCDYDLTIHRTRLPGY